MLQRSIKLKVIEERIMFGKFSEQVKKSSQPVNSLVALNAKRLEALSQMQTEFFTGFMADSLKYVESMSVQTEVKGVIAAQTSYAEALKDRFAHASKDTYGAMNNIREEYTDLLKTSLNESVANVPAATHATATAAAPIKPVVPADKPAVQAAPKKAEAKIVATPAATIVSSTPANAEAKKL
jgi:phasin family protein